MLKSIKDGLLKYKFVLLSEFVLLIILGTFSIALSGNKISQTEGVKIIRKPVVKQVSPTPVPITNDNVENTISASQENFDSVLGQMDADLSKINQIDSSQDSLSGL